MGRRVLRAAAMVVRPVTTSTVPIAATVTHPLGGQGNVSP